MTFDEAALELRLVVARLARYYRCPLSEILDMEIAEITEWAETIPELERGP
ncbi:hypothetical protein KL86APRO_40044 [uncultured Alphaproteobacteria bacterium]|uniref:Uncharacterized protein n=1 Tax=uncultured Alphaproteobacteria bacterium TaxID=91750 RepID=A0A212KN10_9PROT|nr:hypothetical protein KL86APRO_40044 [uncultured Alphaproteobacteria bacterium]